MDLIFFPIPVLFILIPPTIRSSPEFVFIYFVFLFAVHRLLARLMCSLLFCLMVWILLSCRLVGWIGLCGLFIAHLFIWIGNLLVWNILALRYRIIQIVVVSLCLNCFFYTAILLFSIFFRFWFLSTAQIKVN